MSVHHNLVRLPPESAGSTAHMPGNLIELAQLAGSDLRALHAQGRAPALEQLRGVAEGLILPARGIWSLRFWRGKVFDWQTGEPGGMNRLGAGPFEFQRYRFKARIGNSAFGDREVVLLDHDQPGNPYWVRIFHDELVQVQPGLYVATSHIRVGGRLKFLGYFALQILADGSR